MRLGTGGMVRGSEAAGLRLLAGRCGPLWRPREMGRRGDQRARNSDPEGNIVAVENVAVAVIEAREGARLRGSARRCGDQYRNRNPGSRERSRGGQALKARPGP